MGLWFWFYILLAQGAALASNLLTPDVLGALHEVEDDCRAIEIHSFGNADLKTAVDYCDRFSRAKAVFLRSPTTENLGECLSLINGLRGYLKSIGWDGATLK